MEAQFLHPSFPLEIFLHPFFWSRKTLRVGRISAIFANKLPKWKNYINWTRFDEGLMMHGNATKQRNPSPINTYIPYLSISESRSFSKKNTTQQHIRKLKQKRKKIEKMRFFHKCALNPMFLHMTCALEVGSHKYVRTGRTQSDNVYNFLCDRTSLRLYTVNLWLRKKT